MPLGDVQVIETAQPGYTVQRIAWAQSYINARLRKRYGNGRGNALPLGQSPPALVAVGTLPPSIILQGRPILGSIQIGINITTPGALGTAILQFTLDGGNSYTTGVLSAPSVALTGSGLAANMAVGSYGADNAWSASPPVPETVLGWLVNLVTLELYKKRGADPQDPMIKLVVEACNQSLAEIKEAAESKEGLFDLPVSDDLDSAVTTGGPLGYTETSPYRWTDIEVREGVRQDRGRGGFGNGGPGVL